MSEKKKKIRKIDGLSVQNKNFLLSYLELGRNATKAYMKVFPNAKYATAAVQANRLLKKPNISEALQEYLEDLWNNREKQISNIFDRHVDIACSDISDYIDEFGNIRTAEFKNLNTYPIAQYDQAVTDTKEGQSVKQSIKLADKQKSLIELSKILGMIKEDEKQPIEIIIKPAERPEEKAEN